MQEYDLLEDILKVSYLSENRKPPTNLLKIVDLMEDLNTYQTGVSTEDKLEAVNIYKTC